MAWWDKDIDSKLAVTHQKIEDIKPLVHKMEKAIEKLPEKYQWVIKLYLMEGYDHTEISEILQIAQKTSRTRHISGYSLRS